jgi:hypothetical protein
MSQRGLFYLEVSGQGKGSREIACPAKSGDLRGAVVYWFWGSRQRGVGSAVVGGMIKDGRKNIDADLFSPCAQLPKWRAGIQVSPTVSPTLSGVPTEQPSSTDLL